MLAEAAEAVATEADAEVWLSNKAVAELADAIEPVTDATIGRLSIGRVVGLAEAVESGAELSDIAVEVGLLDNTVAVVAIAEAEAIATDTASEIWLSNNAVAKAAEAVTTETAAEI